MSFLKIWGTMVRGEKGRSMFCFLNDIKNIYLNMCYYNYYIDSKTQNNTTKTKSVYSADLSLLEAAFDHDYYHQGHWTRQISLFSGTYASGYKN